MVHILMFRSATGQVVQALCLGGRLDKSNHRVQFYSESGITPDSSLLFDVSTRMFVIIHKVHPEIDDIFEVSGSNYTSISCCPRTEGLARKLPL
jgi:hypothetical protein